MKTTRMLLSLMLLCLAVACQKDADPVDEATKKMNSAVAGRWKLVELLSDPGDGSGVFKPVPNGAGHIIEFKSNGVFVEQKGIAQSSVPNFNAYKVLDERTIEMIPIDRNMPTHIWTYTDRTDSSIMLSYGCFEACRGKYIRLP